MRFPGKELRIWSQVHAIIVEWRLFWWFEFESYCCCICIYKSLSFYYYIPHFINCMSIPNEHLSDQYYYHESYYLHDLLTEKVTSGWNFNLVWILRSRVRITLLKISHLSELCVVCRSDTVYQRYYFELLNLVHQSIKSLYLRTHF